MVRSGQTDCISFYDEVPLDYPASCVQEDDEEDDDEESSEIQATDASHLFSIW